MFLRYFGFGLERKMSKKFVMKECEKNQMEKHEQELKNLTK